MSCASPCIEYGGAGGFTAYFCLKRFRHISQRIALIDIKFHMAFRQHMKQIVFNLIQAVAGVDKIKQGEALCIKRAIFEDLPLSWF